MYKQNELLIKRIKDTAASKNVLIKQMLEDLGLGRNAMSNFKTSMPSSATLAKIAKYLNCSTDYLLGLTDEAEKKAADISADSPDPDTQKAIDYLNFIAEHDPEALQKAAEYAKFLLQDKP